MSIRLTPKTLVLAAALIGSAAHAQQTWNLITNGTMVNNVNVGMCAQTGTPTGTFDNQFACNNGTSSVTVSSWSTDRGTGTGNAQAGTSATFNSSTASVAQGAGTTFANAFTTTHGTSGFGAANRTEGLGATSPNHAFDSIPNDPNRVELMLLDFGTNSVVLNQVGIGWKNGTGSGDMMVMRWVGATTGAIGTAAASVGGNSTLSSARCTNGVVTACWSLVGAYADLGVDNSNPYGGAAAVTGATGSMASSWWMISTFNTALNGNSTTCRNANGVGTTTCSEGNDSFKINFIRATTAQVPVTGSLALAALGLFAAFVARRRAVV